MNVDMFVIIVGVSSLILGVLLGILIFKIYNYCQNKKLLKNAQEVLDGKRNNKIKIDGKEYDATKFRVRDDQDREKLIDLKGGDIIQNEKENKIIDNKRKQKIKDTSNPKQDSGEHREDDPSNGKKKRNSRTRSRIRRFG